MTWFYNLIIGIGGLIIGLLAFADEIAEKIKYFNNLKSLVFKIPFFLLGSAMIIWATIQKDTDNETKEEQKEAENKKVIAKMDSAYRFEKRISDSITNSEIKRIIDSSYLKSIKASNEALAKYNLTFIDSLHSVASTINTKASLAQLTIDAITNGNPPLYLSEDSLGKYLKVRYISANATSYNVKVNTYILKESGIGNLVLQSSVHSGQSDFLVPGVSRTQSILLNKDVLNTEKAVILFLISFSRDDKATNVINNRFAFDFNFKEGKFIRKAIDINYDLIMEHFKQFNIPH